MNRQDLLNLAAQRPAANAIALDLATRLTTKSDIDSATRHLTTSTAELKRRWPWIMAFTFGSIVLAVALIMGYTVINDGKHGSNAAFLTTFGMAIILTLLFCAGCYLLDSEPRKLRRNSDRLGLLQPIAGTSDCQTALKYIEKGYTSVTAWRDIAVAERDVLSGFDVEVLRCLHDMAESAISQDEVRKANEEACRKLHGLMPLAHNPQ